MHEGTVGRRGRVMEKARGEGLARPGFAENQHRRRVGGAGAVEKGGEGGNLAPHRCDGRAFPRQFGLAAASRVTLARPGETVLQPPRGQRPRRHDRQFVEVHGLAQIVRRAALHRRHGAVHIAEGRHHHHRHALGLGEEIEPRTVGQTHIEQHQVDGVGQRRPRPREVADDGAGVSLATQPGRHRLGEQGFVVDDEDRAAHGRSVPLPARRAAGIDSTTRAPPPAPSANSSVPSWSSHTL